MLSWVSSTFVLETASENERRITFLKTLTMKLFLVALLGLVTMAAAQNDTQDFEVYWEGTECRDIQLDKIKNSQTLANSLARQLTSVIQTGEYNFDSAGRQIPVPPGYVMARNSSIDMFDNDSANNQQETETTTTTTSTRSPRSNSASSSRSTRHAPFPLYHCPHVAYLLRWFPVNSYGAWKICFIPWAWHQRISYVKCRPTSCTISLFERRGTCQPTCYQRRYILAFCFRFSSGWGWSWELMYLPQACRCST